MGIVTFKGKTKEAEFGLPPLHGTNPGHELIENGMLVENVIGANGGH
jgi:hypothetical protein